MTSYFRDSTAREGGGAAVFARRRPEQQQPTGAMQGDHQGRSHAAVSWGKENAAGAYMQDPKGRRVWNYFWAQIVLGLVRFESEKNALYF